MTDDHEPFIVVGNEELARSTDLGMTVKCWMCGKDHAVEYGKKQNEDGSWSESKLIAFMTCKEKAYMCGVNGKELRP